MLEDVADVGPALLVGVAPGQQPALGLAGLEEAGGGSIKQHDASKTNPCDKMNGGLWDARLQDTAFLTSS